MNFKRLISVLITLALFLVTGCSMGSEYEKQNIIVQKRIEKENKYEDSKKITNNKHVKEVKRILKETNWKSAQVDFFRPADYQFSFQFENPDIESKTVIYSVWNHSKKDILQISTQGGEYTQLTKEESSILFEIISGEKMDDF
ncbi:hypothetical protein [Rossellomorea aquimaris]|uniref:hypothetical protein n=1 Tax=Rossellomorea aquimaris TaxID=189382 RepID=UPI0007D06591|nr:hypothetical protein [Rossellomorea aquimaris]